jgi:hypothetical protein
MRPSSFPPENKKARPFSGAGLVLVVIVVYTVTEPALSLVKNALLRAVVIIGGSSYHHRGDGEDGDH